jgi:hypothetical protein
VPPPPLSACTPILPRESYNRHAEKPVGSRGGRGGARAGSDRGSLPSLPPPSPRHTPTIGFPSNSSVRFKKMANDELAPVTAPAAAPQPEATIPGPSRSAFGRRRSARGTRWCGASWRRSRDTPSSASATASCRPPTPSPRRAPSRPRPSTSWPPREALQSYSKEVSRRLLDFVKSYSKEVSRRLLNFVKPPPNPPIFQATFLFRNCHR